MSNENGSRKRFNPEILGFLTLVVMSIGLYMAFLYAPREKTMGDIQRIFYVHVPIAISSFVAYTVVFIASVTYLVKKSRKWDIVAHASAEVGTLFCTLMLITGAIWAKYAWGHWWVWSPRLTLSLVLWLIFVAYLMLRYYVEGENKRANLSAVVGIIGFVNVPFVYMSIRWWRDQHPEPVLEGGDSTLDPAMRLTLYVCVSAFLLLYFYILSKRIKIDRCRESVEDLFKLVEDRSP